jgi:tetratricopeptide (TPR) repeat protein
MTGFAMRVQLSAIPGAFHLPRPNWEVIRAWVEAHVPKGDWALAWSDIVRQWLEMVKEALGGGYQLHDAGDKLLLAPSAFEQPESLIKVAASALTSVQEILGDVVGEGWRGPLPVLVFADADTYYHYISPFFPEGDFGSSAGVCLRREHTHVALYGTSLDRMEMTLVHELVHACLGHLKLPLWLEEGVTQSTEKKLHSWRRFTLDGEKAQQLKAYWRERGLRDFWWGTGFTLPDEGQQNSYLLARILFHLLVTDYSRQFLLFFRQAREEDAGEGSAREHLGQGLAELASRFLGPGSWAPLPADVPTWVRRGAFYQERGQTERAAADLTEALRLDPRCGAALRSRGFAHSQLRQYDRAVADYEAALQLDARDYHTHNNLAWLLATCPEKDYRDGARAVEHATTACELSNFDSWFCLGTLAAAHAEAGDFEEARKWARESMRLAPEPEQQGCKERLNGYKAGRPYRELPVPGLRQ